MISKVPSFKFSHTNIQTWSNHRNKRSKYKRTIGMSREEDDFEGKKQDTGNMNEVENGKTGSGFQMGRSWEGQYRQMDKASKNHMILYLPNITHHR